MILLEHTKWMILELVRQPAYMVSTIGFPSLFYLIFAVPESTNVDSSNFLLASFASFAVFGVVFLQFGVGISQERSKTWYYYLKTLPIHPITLLFARFLSTVFFSVLASIGVGILAVSFTKAHLTIDVWITFYLMLIILSLVFCPMGLILGYFTNPKTSLPIGNMIYLPLSFMGGMWRPPKILPETIKDVSSFLPTRHYSEIMWAIVSGSAIEIQYVFWLLFYLCLFSAIAFWGYKKDQMERLS